MQRSWRETCREATLICTNYTPVRWVGGGGGGGGRQTVGNIWACVRGMQMICDRRGGSRRKEASRVAFKA